MRHLRIPLLGLVALVATGLGLWVSGQLARGQFTDVTFSVTVDETDPSGLTPPGDDECPVGDPCKHLVDLAINDVGQDLADITVIIPPGFTTADGTTVGNGHLTGNVTAVLNVVPLFGSCNLPVIVTTDVVDGALPGETTDDGTAAALGDPNVWPTLVQSDARVADLLSSGHSIIQRSTGVATITIIIITVDVPINLLYFDVSDGNGFGGLTDAGTYAVLVLGEPGEGGALPVEDCTPLSSLAIALGETPEGELLQSCTVEGTDAFKSVFTTEGSTTVEGTISDDTTCSCPDSDSDSWSDCQEAIIGTDPFDDCADTSTPNDERGPAFGEPLSPLPPDLNDDRFMDITDIVALAGDFGQAVAPVGTAQPRHDIAPDPPDGFVDIQDIVRLAALFGQSCTP